MAVTLVLGFLTQLIAMVIMAFGMMKTLQSSLLKHAKMYQEDCDK